MRIAIVGAGIAGPTLAYWLARHGHRPTLIERAPALRTGGYVIDFWGAAFDIAEQMAIVPALRRDGYDVKEVRFVGRHGQRVGGFGADVFAQLAGGRYVSLPRSALSAAIVARLDDRTEVLFGEDVVAIDDRDDEVCLTSGSGAVRRFDLVVGADGLHSRVRALALGDDPGAETYLGYHVAAAQVEGYRPRDEDVYVMHSGPGHQIGRFAMRDDRTLFLFVWVEPAATPLPEDAAGRRSLLRARFEGTGWEAAKILEAVDGSSDLYLDRVSQIRIPRWSRGRVALIGDAAHAVSLLAGQGSALAMIGAATLAAELRDSGGDHVAAFAAYEARLRSFIESKQRAAERFAGTFAPRTRLGVALRNLGSRLLAIPFVARRAFDAELRDTIALPALD